MSNETTASETSKPTVDIDAIIANSPFKDPLTITRNGVSETLKVFIGKRGAWDNRAFAAPQLEVTTGKSFLDDEVFLNGLIFVGKENLTTIINNSLRRTGQDILVDAVDSTTGLFNRDAYVKSWEEMQAAALKLSELKELLDIEQRKHEAYITNTLLPLVTKATSGNATPEELATLEEAKAITTNRTSTINALRHDMAKRSARNSKETETNTTMPE